MTVTITDRQNATEVISKLRETLTRKQIAEFIGICPAYVTTALYRTKRGDEYYTPAIAITKILTFAAKISTVGR